MKNLSAFIVGIFFLSPCLFAQNIDDTLRYAESIWSMQKKAIILEQMKLTEAEKSAFWPVYESYSNAIQYLEMDCIRLLNYRDDAQMSEKKRGTITEHILLNEVLLAKTRKQYFKKFKKALSPSQAGKFMQLDNDFRTLLRIQMQKESPALMSSVNGIYSSN